MAQSHGKAWKTEYVRQSSGVDFKSSSSLSFYRPPASRFTGSKFKCERSGRFTTYGLDRNEWLGYVWTLGEALSRL